MGQTTAAQEKVLATVPDKYRVLTEKAYRGVCSPRQAIKARCAECVGYEETVRSIANCTSSICALWRYRPYQDREETSDE